ncbi:hypothetical protein [Helicobacter sp.]|uniref:hypothetical protein n=1 Tax=Helicobacter sp. TaxID=218 RepID=UPI002A754B7D|nr:hypothetical protein [Helicobacter sp.]MDY2585321.1 hypothetical protein [Helicobacter sp.]
MLELLKNIGLGFFVNGNYALLNGDITLVNAYIVLGSIALFVFLNKERINNELRICDGWSFDILFDSCELFSIFQKRKSPQTLKPTSNKR